MFRVAMIDADIRSVAKLKRELLILAFQEDVDIRLTEFSSVEQFLEQPESWEFHAIILSVDIGLDECKGLLRFYLGCGLLQNLSWILMSSERRVNGRFLSYGFRGYLHKTESAKRMARDLLEHLLPRIYKERSFRMQFRRKTIIIRERDIVFFESSGRKLVVHTLQGVHVFYGKLSDVQASIGNDFVRIHGSYLINSLYFERLHGSLMVLKDRTELKVSKRYLPDIRERF